MQKAKHVCDLPFVAVNEANQVVSMWMVASSGDYDKDNETGRTYGAELIDFMQRTGNPNILGNIIRDMIRSGTYQGIEIGFMYMVGAYLVLVQDSPLKDYVQAKVA